MASIEICDWGDFVGFTAWDAHARSELRRRLRRGIHASPAEIRRLARRIEAREKVCLERVFDEAVGEISQMLQTMGAVLQVSTDQSDPRALLQRFPKRSGHA